MLDTLRDFHSGTTIHDPTNKIRYNTQVTSYIDDNNFLLINDKHENILKVNREAQTLFNSWNGILTETGGKLNIEKCFGYNWTYSDPSKSKISDIPITIHEKIRNLEVPTSPCKNSTKYLGIHITPHNDFDNKFKLFKEQCNHIAKKMKMKIYPHDRHC